MNITRIQVKQQNDYNEISGFCDDYNLFFRFPTHIVPELRADAFIAASLIPSMLTGRDIIIDDDIPVSSKLLKNIEKLQDIFYLWGPYFNKPLNRIKIIGGIESAPISTNMSTVSFFSGGVDGTHTFLKNQDSIDYLLFSKGIDMQLSSNELYNIAFAKNEEFLNKKGKNLYSIESNVRFLGHEYGLSWNICFGGGLSSIALAGGFKGCYIASGLSYADMYPHGSIFVSDHLWGNEHTEIIHDGAELRRIDKIKSIAKDPDVLNIIRVCWHDKGYNCGECEKCLRTMTSLRALGISAPTFPECTDEVVTQKVAKLKLYEEHDGSFLAENLYEANQLGDTTLIKALTKVQRNFQLRESIRMLDEALFGQCLAKFKKWSKSQRS